MLPFLFCLLFFKKINTKEKKVFFLYTILISILVIVGFSLLYIFNSPESYYRVVRIYLLLEFSVLVYLFSLYIKRIATKKIGAILLCSFLLFCIYDFYIEKAPGMPFLPASIAHILLLIIIIYFFFETMQEVVPIPIYQKAIFWISVAFIINSAGNFFLFLYSKNSYNDETFRRQYTIIYTTVTVIKNLLLCISILIKETPKISSSTETFDIDLDSFNPIKNLK